MKGALRGLACAAVAVVAATASGSAAAGDPKDAQTDKVRRGEYLVTIGACHDCHTPMKMTPDGPFPNMELMLSGHPEGSPDPGGTLGPNDLVLSGPDLTAWKQAFGLVYARNLTPDKTGLGEWTEAQFVSTIRRGRHQGDGRALLPPMPWMQYAAWTDDDAKAVWAYLRTVKPIKNTVPDPRVPPPVLEQFARINQGIAEGVKAHWFKASGGK